ncbi:MAG: hypothetical protein GX638_17990 [Crenarchaeota archaeon]|nr:hypothetical protein [Thermoproteota archaeon]
MRSELKSVIGLLITVLAVAIKFSGSINSQAAILFNGSAASIGLLIILSLGIFMFAYYAMPETPIDKTTPSQTELS